MLIKQIRHHYPKFKLDIRNLELAKGHVIGLVGDNDAGKTTLLRILSGTVMANEAFVVTDYSADTILYISSQIEPYHYLKVKDFCKLVIDYAKKSRQLTVEACLSQLDMVEQADVLMSELSRGERRKLSLINTYLTQYELVIVDEPFSGIDAKHAKVMKQRIAALASDSTVIVSSHNLDMLFDICDTFVHLEAGQVKQVFHRPESKEALEAILYV